jgi:hypothetical protein
MVAHTYVCSSSSSSELQVGAVQLKLERVGGGGGGGEEDGDLRERLNAALKRIDSLEEQLRSTKEELRVAKEEIKRLKQKYEPN